jgi:tRNA(fMet)-specific endonuclease VapC
VKYLLDTNICIRYLNRRIPSVIARFHATPEEEIVVCSVVRAELLSGALKSQDVARTLVRQRAFIERFISLPFDDSAAEFYAHIRANLERGGTPIGSNDMLIAAIAMANELTVVTHNTREFGRIAGLKIDDWEAGGDPPIS